MRKENTQGCIQFPSIALLIPHQYAPRTYVFRDEGDFWDAAEQEGGDNWEWPGHREEDEEGEYCNWVSDRTIDDGIESLGHDVYGCHLCWSEAEARKLYSNLNPEEAMFHQCFAARRALKDAADRLGWIVRELA